MGKQRPYSTVDLNDLLYDKAKPVVDAEFRHIKAWRGLKHDPQVGLALSGGGIRSASFCLGVLQALAHEQTLPKFDYLSTVSGGGYIGASLSYLLHVSAQEAHAGGSDAMPKFDVSRENFPYVSYPMVGVEAPAKDRGAEEERVKGRLLRRLRRNGKYLTPGNGISLLSLAGVLLRSVAASVVVHVALLVLLFQLLFTSTLLPLNETLPSGGRQFELPAFAHINWVLMFAAAALLIYVLVSAGYVVLTRCFDCMEKRAAEEEGEKSHAWRMTPYWWRRQYDWLAHWLFVVGIAALVLGILPLVHELLAKYDLLSLSTYLNMFDGASKNKPAAFGAIATLIGVIGNVWGFLQTRSTKKPWIPTGLVVSVASAALLFGVLLLVYVLTRSLNLPEGSNAGVVVLVVALGTLFLFGWIPDANYVSLHRFYRDRLLELFLPDVEKIRKRVKGADEEGVGASIPGDTTMLGALCCPPPSDSSGDSDKNNTKPETTPEAKLENKLLLRGPYHIMNANVVLVASKHPRYRGRGGDNYILSPLFCGSQATTWKPTDPSRETGLTLATAMAISGAALNPNAGPSGEGITRQPVLSVLMGMLNLRLGYWDDNPNYETPAKASKPKKMLSRWGRPNLLAPGLFESFGRFNLHEHKPFVLLTDGGHFENLGLYELVRRRLKLIVVCDAAADPNFGFADLANAIEKVRADFGAIVEVTSEDLTALVPARRAGATGDDQEQTAAERGYLIAPIRYSLRPEQTSNSVPDEGLLIVLKATLFRQLTADLHGYHRGHVKFPNESTGDQFFDERQFEAYRELGFQTAWHMMHDVRAATHKPQVRPEHKAAALLWD